MTRHFKRKPVQYLDDPEFCQFIRGCDRLRPDPRWRHRVEFFWLMLFTGSRESEIAALRIEHCHENYIEILAGKDTTGEGGKYRTADVYPLAMPHYHAYLKVRQQANDTPWMFPGQCKVTRQFTKKKRKGEAYTRMCEKWHTPAVATRTVRDWWAMFCKEINLRPIVLHGLRRTFITWMADERLPRHKIQRQVGHTDYRVTDRYYIETIPGRVFCSDEPEWKRVARASAEKLLESQGVIQLNDKRKEKG